MNLLKQLDRERRKHFLFVEFLVSIVIGVGFWLYLFKFAASPIDALLHGNRANIYLALVATFGTLLGFVITATSIVVGYISNPALALVRTSPFYPQLWKIFIQTMYALGAASIMSLIGLVGDRDGAVNHWILSFCVYFTVLAAFRMWRSVWAFERVVKIVAKNPQA